MVGDAAPRSRGPGDVTTTHAAFCAAITSGDARAAASTYAAEAWLLPPSGAPVHGREAVEAFWRAGIGAGLWSITFRRSGLYVDRGVALEVGSYVLHLEPSDGSEVGERGTYLQIHQRRVDGTWERLAESLLPFAHLT